MNIGRNESELQESLENFDDPPEADTVYDVESNRMLCYIVSIVSSGGVCVVGMYEIVKPRNLGNPSRSYNL